MVNAGELTIEDIVSINSPSGEGGGVLENVCRRNDRLFPLILLQAKAGGYWLFPHNISIYEDVSINSPSGEGGGIYLFKKPNAPQPNVSINSPSGEGGGNPPPPTGGRVTISVSINSPSGEGGGFLVDKYLAEDKQKMFPLILLQAKAGGV